jgi:hypothetical protein
MCRRGRAHEVTYEDCHRDFASVLRRLLIIFDLEADDDAIIQAAEASRFAAMKAVERAGGFAEPWMRLRNEAPKLRRGEAGAYRDYLSEEDVAYLRGVFGLK